MASQELRQQKVREFKASMDRFIPPPMIGPTLPRGPFTMDEYTDAILRFGHDPMLWWCDEHRHLAPMSVPCPECHKLAVAERLRVEKLIRDATRRAGYSARRPFWARIRPNTRAAKRWAKRRGGK